MSRRLFIWVFLLLLTGSAYAQNRVSLADGRVSFVVPDGFRAMTRNEIAVKFPTANPPQTAYSNERGGVSIAVTFSRAAVPLHELPALKTAMEQMLPQLTPGLEWISRELVEINGQPWVHFELTSAAVDTRIHNHMYLTSFEGKMLGINMNSTISEYPSYARALAQSRNSIRISR